MKFGAGESLTFDIGEAEYVAEGANKGRSTVTPTTKTVKPFKFHKTLRMTEEVLWADEDHQLEVVDQILDLIQPALSRALDFGVFHEINPTGGAVVAAMNGGLNDTTNSVEIAACRQPHLDLDAADALVLADGFVPRDIALDPAYAGRLRSPRAPLATGEPIEQKLYPNFLATAPAGRSGEPPRVGVQHRRRVGVVAVATNVLGVRRRLLRDPLGRPEADRPRGHPVRRPGRRRRPQAQQPGRLPRRGRLRLGHRRPRRLRQDHDAV